MLLPKELCELMAARKNVSAPGEDKQHSHQKERLPRLQLTKTNTDDSCFNGGEAQVQNTNKHQDQLEKHRLVYKNNTTAA